MCLFVCVYNVWHCEYINFNVLKSSRNKTDLLWRHGTSVLRWETHRRRRRRSRRAHDMMDYSRFRSRFFNLSTWQQWLLEHWMYHQQWKHTYTAAQAITTRWYRKTMPLYLCLQLLYFQVESCEFVPLKTKINTLENDIFDDLMTP